MGRATRAWISRKGWYVTILFEDGSRTTISFKEFLRTFKDYSRAVNEYASFVWASMGATRGPIGSLGNWKEGC